VKADKVSQRSRVLFSRSKPRSIATAGTQPTLTPLFGFPKISADDVARKSLQAADATPSSLPNFGQNSRILTVNQPQKKAEALLP